MLQQYMKNVLILLIVLISWYGFLKKAEALNYNDQCTAPNNQSGVCIKLVDCKGVFAMLQTNLTNKGKRYLAESQCGKLQNVSETSQQILVCCTPDDMIETPSSLLPKPGQCGTHLANRIYGGSEADPKEYPWIVIIFYQKPNGILSANCAGSLINPRYVLSAAHCVKNPTVPSILSVHSVRLGEYDFDNDFECFDNETKDDECFSPINIEVEDVIVHELYQTNDLNQHHDISLIRMNKSVDYSTYIKPICLPLDQNLQQKDYLDVRMDIAGWGSTERSYTSSKKMKAYVMVLNLAECQEKFKSFDIKVNASQLCAGSTERMDTCRGDSGGPLMVEEKNYIYAAGIVSYGPRPCGLLNWPGVYTRVGYYIPWILENIKP